MAWFLRNLQYSDGIYISSGKKFVAEESGRLVPQPQVGDADYSQCGLLPELFGWRDDEESAAQPQAVKPESESAQQPAQSQVSELDPQPAQAQVSDLDQQPAQEPASAVKKPARKLSKLIGG